MGISTIQSYRGAQIFEAIGLHPSLVEKYFTGTASRVGGIGLDVIAREVRARHNSPSPNARSTATSWRSGGSLSMARRRRVPFVQPADRPQTPASLPQRGLQGLQGIFAGWSTTSPRKPAPFAACSNSRPPRSPFPSRKSNLSKPSSNASNPARCPTAPSARKPTRPWPSP